MMSLIDLDDDQRWVPTHVNVTVLRARGLRTKGKHGSRYLYTIIQVGKEKYTTGLVEKAEVPVWNEECCFELLPGILEEGGRFAYPPGSGDLVLTVMHRVLIGLDVFLGQTIIPLDQIFHDGVCPRDEWFKLNSKVGRKEKERGELQVTVQFTRNNMTASMFDLTMKDKPRSAFGKLKDRVTGRKRGDVESSSAILPGRYAALSGSLGQPFGEEGGGVVESQEVDVTEEKRSKMKDFFKGRLRKSSDTRSCSSLASESSMSSMASDNLGPPLSLDLLSDPPSSPIYTSKVRVDAHYGETDLAKKVLTSQHTTKILTHKRAFSDEARRITTALPRTNVAVESLKGQTMSQSKSSLCINGSHVYDSEPSTPKISGALPSKLVLLEKCSPLSRSLQNLTKRGEDKSSFADGRRWSFDKLKKEEKEEEKDASAQEAQTGDSLVQAAMPIVSSAGCSPEKGRKLRKTFSAGRSDSLPAKSDLNQAIASSEGRLRGWFGSGDSQNKPRLEVSPKVESSSDVPPSHSSCSPILPPWSSPSASPSDHVSPDNHSHINLFTPSSSPSSTPLSPSNPFLPCMQRNPFFEELITEELEKLPSVAPFSSSGSPPFHYTTLLADTDPEVGGKNRVSIKRERPRPVAKQISLPALLPKRTTPNSPIHSNPCFTSKWEESFDAFACSRLNSPKDRLPPEQPRTSPTLSCKHSFSPVDNICCNYAQEPQRCDDEPPPLPPRRFIRTSVNEIFSDGWLHRGQELAVHKEAYLLSQTGVASLQRGREGEKRENPSPNPSSSSGTSESLGVHTQPYANNSSLGLMSEENPKRFKYEPLEDEADCWGGTLFEQDLYGRACRGNYGLNSPLSMNAKENAGNKTPFKDSGSKGLLDSDHFSIMSIVPPNVPNISYTPAEETEESSPCESTCLNNNISFSLTLEDLNMNLNNSDFSFIDSDGSTHSEVADNFKNNPGENFLPQDSQLEIYHRETTPGDIFKLKDTYIPTLNSSFEIPAFSKKLCKVPPVCQDNGQDCPCELTNVALCGPCGSKSQGVVALVQTNPTSNSSNVETGQGGEQIMCNDDFEKTKKDCDDNGNLEDNLKRPKQTESFSGVVSARIRPKVASRQNSSDSPSNQSMYGDREFVQFLSLVQNISEVSEGPLTYQPTKSMLSSLQVLEQPDKPKLTSINDQTHQFASNTIYQKCSLDTTVSCATENASTNSFEDLHAKVAPNCRTPSKTKIGKSLPEHKSCSPSTPFTLPLLADSLVRCPLIQTSSTGSVAKVSTLLAMSTDNPSLSTTFTTDQPLTDARHSLLPEETQPAGSLPHQESRSHPVKPLTSSQPEKKEGRSVLEKLKSTINPGRSTHQAIPEPEKKDVTADRVAQYQLLTNMELISLLLQQEMDMETQKAASEQQGAQLQKCESELKKVKAQVRDLEDYIDNLLLRIMEQTPTLLQVRSRHK
ncbi:rab11 family-interacting protein 1 isoform X1 [Girardinichthys multiradiatus]|uniref:rab11 family-interacting protein 1 isoform X1 n=1 Tax=Girardinichthys multiradiatus TaxID=208333 RepID=UPI001FACF8F2|nr:rab11 family-interacting protein 1 isoform X1 [Girardinichthys multiradiatus]